MTLIAEVVRSGFVECQHHGSLVVVDRSGSVLVSIGEPHQPMLPRSSNKPMQSAGMVHAGLDLPPPLLAVATASHAGEPMHISRVQRILTTAGLTEAALRCPTALPGDEAARNEVICADGHPESKFMNCSGKHAAMLATCVVNGWPTSSYLDVDHPLQQRLAATVAHLAGEPIAHIAIDGCGAPIFGLTLTGLARAFSTMAVAQPSSPEGRVVAACRAHPLLVAGTHRPDGQLAASLPELFAKIGAEGVYAAALPDGRAFAVRTEDGGSRATQVVVAEALLALGADSEVLRVQRRGVVLGRGEPVGEVRTTDVVTSSLARLAP